MKLIIALLLLIEVVSPLSAQPTARAGIANCLDSFMIVRSAPSFDAIRVYDLKDGEAFEIDYDFDNTESKWIRIYIQLTAAKQLSGFIRKSCITLIDSLPPAEKIFPILKFEITQADSSLVIDEENFTINGVRPFGLEIPLNESFEVKHLFLNWNDTITIQEANFYQDLYNITYETGQYASTGKHFKTYSNKGKYYILQECGDGAYFYWIIWVIENGRITQRLVVEL
jgi:hypothetical protein